MTELIIHANGNEQDILSSEMESDGTIKIITVDAGQKEIAEFPPIEVGLSFLTKAENPEQFTVNDAVAVVIRDKIESIEKNGTKLGFDKDYARKTLQQAQIILFSDEV